MPIKNEKGSAMVAVLSIGIILTVTFISFFFFTRHTTKTSGHRRVKVSALNIAEAGKERLFGEINTKKHIPSPQSEIIIFQNVPFENGFYSVSYSSNATADTLLIRSTGRINGGDTSIIEVIAAIAPEIKINFPPVRGAITSRHRVRITGNITVDGRNYDEDGNLIDTSISKGTFGVSTCDTVSREGSAGIGGNGVEPVDKKSDFEKIRGIVVEENIPVTPVFNSPEAFLGLPPGSLDRFKSSDPTFLETSGIVYKTCDIDIQTGSFSGILIVHNSWKNAQLRITSTFDFKGIIIADQMDKITGDATILGAVVTLTESEVSTFGNGSAQIYFSQAVLNKLNEYCNNIPLKVTQISWKEVR